MRKRKRKFYRLEQQQLEQRSQWLVRKESLKEGRDQWEMEIVHFLLLKEKR